jgi:hypothetical protein
VTVPADVPVFNCIVHVAPRDAEGLVAARVVNLPGIACRGKSEREVIGQCVVAFKSAVAAATAAGDSIAWIDPPPRPAPGETERLIAVHL